MFPKRETSNIKDFEATKNACHEQKQAFFVYPQQVESAGSFGYCLRRRNASASSCESCGIRYTPSLVSIGSHVALKLYLFYAINAGIVNRNTKPRMSAGLGEKRGT